MSDFMATHCPCSEECPLQVALKRIGGKWKIPILCVLSNNKGIRYNEMPIRVEYFITDKSKDVMPTLQLLAKRGKS